MTQEQAAVLRVELQEQLPQYRFFLLDRGLLGWAVIVERGAR